MLAAIGLAAEGEDRCLDAVLQAEFGEDAAVGTSLAQGRYLNAATEREPVAVLGAAATASYARGHHELLVIPAEAWAGGLAASIVIGAVAGLLPAIRAARLSPTQALWSI